MTNQDKKSNKHFIYQYKNLIFILHSVVSIEKVYYYNKTIKNKSTLNKIHNFKNYLFSILFILITYH
jgi:hypothetical protein